MHYGSFRNDLTRPTTNPTMPKWTEHLIWPTGSLHQCLPSPIKEITHDDWFNQGICSPYGPNDSYYWSGWLSDSPHSPPNDRGYQQWLEPQWSCYVDIYHTHALIIAKQFTQRHQGPFAKEPNPGIGTFIPSSSGSGGYVLRFFRMGCEHHFIDAGESYMCYHSRICTKCGLRDDIDSSG